MTDEEMAETLLDLLRGFGPMYLWTVRVDRDIFGEDRPVFRIDLVLGKAGLTKLIPRFLFDNSRLSLWDQAQIEARYMIAEFAAREIGALTDR